MGALILLLFVSVAVLMALAVNKIRNDSKLRHMEFLVQQESDLVKHAHEELIRAGKNPDKIEWYLNVVKTYAEYDHSGDSAASTLKILHKLLQYENLTPLTDDPDEWELYSGEVWDETSDMWRSKRNNSAFSMDGGKSYYLLPEFNDSAGDYPLHVSEKHDR